MQRKNDHRYEVQYSAAELPAYFALATQYTLCENYFSEVAGPSTPNHLMLICASAPIINNPKHHYRPQPGDVYDLPSLPLALEKAGRSWGNYGGYAFAYIKALKGHRNNHGRDQFITDAKAGRLPTVAWVYGDGHPDLSEHPIQNVTDGMKLTVELIKAVVSGGLWNRSAIFVTYDDWGGWYDHVDPPVKERWDSKMAQRPDDAFPNFNGDPFRFGSRVPCLVVSPFAKRAHLCRQENSHVSLMRFCEDVFGVPSLTERDKNSNGMTDSFDLKQQPLPPPALP